MFSLWLEYYIICHYFGRMTEALWSFAGHVSADTIIVCELISSPRHNLTMRASEVVDAMAHFSWK